MNLNLWILRMFEDTFSLGEATKCNVYCKLLSSYYQRLPRLLIWASKLEKYLLGMCAQQILKSASASAQSDLCLHFPHEDNLYPWLSKMRPVKIRIRLRECWEHTSEGTFLTLRRIQFLTLSLLQAITKTCLYNIDPLKPHFYIVKLGYRGIRYFSYFCS